MPGTFPLRPTLRVLPALTVPLAIALTQAPSAKTIAEAPHELTPRVLASTGPTRIAGTPSPLETGPAISPIATPVPPISDLHPIHPRSHPKNPR